MATKEVEDVSAKNRLCVQAVIPGDRVGLGTLKGREHHRRKVRIAGADRVDKAGGEGINIIGPGSLARHRCSSGDRPGDGVLSGRSPFNG